MSRYLYLIGLLVLVGCDEIPSPPITPETLIQSHTAVQPATVNIQQALEKLEQGMSQQQVKQILGEPDYSPTEGLNYYSSPTPESLVIDYRDSDNEVTQELQSFKLGEIGE